MNPLLFAAVSFSADDATKISIGLTILTLLPAILMSITPFLRISLVLHFLRQALGTQSAPSNQVLIGLALFLTIPLVTPTAQQIYTDAWQPYQKDEINFTTAWERGSPHMRHFLLRFAREKDIALLLEMAHRPAPKSASDLDLSILVPAYMLSELKTGFQIGAVLYLPFLIIDLVVASITLSVGMVQLPPAMLSAPLKILLFVAIDGWNLLAGSLIKTLSGASG